MKERRPASEEGKGAELLIKAIQESYGNLDMHSARFQAFADYVDLLRAEHNALTEGGRMNENHMSYLLMSETIRQRKNGMVGYKKEVEHARKVKDDLKSALGRDNYELGRVPRHIECLTRIKNGILDKKGEQEAPDIHRR